MLDEYIEGTKETDIDWTKYNSMWIMIHIYPNKYW